MFASRDCEKSDEIPALPHRGRQDKCKRAMAASTDYLRGLDIIRHHYRCCASQTKFIAPTLQKEAIKTSEASCSRPHLFHALVDMAPFSPKIANASYSTPANATFGSPPRPTPIACQPVLPVIQNQWGPESISSIVFGPVMVFLSLFAIYQTRKQRSQRPAGEFAE